jgi:hypothetical protein
MWLTERLVDGVVEPVGSFARGAPSPVALYRSRRSAFDDLHVIAPSTVEPGEEVSLTLQAWDRYERLVPGSTGRRPSRRPAPGPSTRTGSALSPGTADWHGSRACGSRPPGHTT